MTKKRMNALLKTKDAMESLMFAAYELAEVIESEDDSINEEDVDFLGEYGFILEFIGNDDLDAFLTSTDVGVNTCNAIDKWEQNHFDEEEA